MLLGEDSGSIFNYSKTTSTVTQSSTHAEIMAIDEIVKHIVFLRDILSFLGFEQSAPTKLYIDIKSAKEICELFKTSHKTSSINMRINYVKQCIDQGLIKLVFIDTKKNVADVLTKPLAEPIFTTHINKLMKRFNGLSIDDYIEGNLMH